MEQAGVGGAEQRSARTALLLRCVASVRDQASRIYKPRDSRRVATAMGPDDPGGEEGLEEKRERASAAQHKAALDHAVGLDELRGHRFRGVDDHFFPGDHFLD